MAKIIITTTAEEKEAVLQAIKSFVGTTVAVSAIARKAGLNQNRVRFVVEDLIESGKVVRVPTKAFNKHYVRYKYEIVQEAN